MISLPVNIDSSTLGLTDHSMIQVNMKDPVTLDPNPDKKYIISLHDISIWYSWDTISSANSNNKFKYTKTGWGTTYKTITFPDGAYSVEMLQDEINNQTYANGDASLDSNGDIKPNIYFTANLATTKMKLNLLNGYQVSFGDEETEVRKFNEILGFDKVLYTTSTTAPNYGNISNGIDSLLVHCDLVSSAYFNGSQSDIICRVPINVGPSSLIEYIPHNLKWVEINKRSFGSFKVWITDQKNRPLLLTDPVTITLDIKQN